MSITGWTIKYGPVRNEILTKVINDARQMPGQSSKCNQRWLFFCKLWWSCMHSIVIKWYVCLQDTQSGIKVLKLTLYKMFEKAELNPYLNFCLTKGSSSSSAFMEMEQTLTADGASGPTDRAFNVYSVSKIALGADWSVKVIVMLMVEVMDLIIVMVGHLLPQLWQEWTWKYLWCL